jgi:hypothetical protein
MFFDAAGQNVFVLEKNKGKEREYALRAVPLNSPPAISILPASR